MVIEKKHVIKYNFNMERKEYIKLLTNKFAEYKIIDLVVLYGSILTNHFNENSDIDIAIASYKSFPPFFILKLKKDLELLCKREIDLFDLSIDEGLINYKIITEGLVIKKNISLFAKHHMKSLIFYEDYFKMYKKIQDEKIRRFLDG